MSECYVESYVIPSANMGELNPLPDIKNNAYIHAKIEVTENVSNEDKKHIGDGMIPTLLPYMEQNGYDRNRADKVYRAVVLENKYLKAVFLPELGGRLWSLIDKETGKDLLYCNPVYQPGNLALRNAWFSGGVEFNVSIKGHNPLTCDSLFVKKIKMQDGTIGARFYEYERIRGVAYGFDAWLPKDSKMLYIRPRIENRTGKEVWMYWWSNIAVPETAETRVVVPTSECFINYFGNNHYVLDASYVPNALDTDVSYPNNLKRSLDFFYRIPDSEQKWITAVDKNGYGLIQCSTKELKGRKLFVWGKGAGGKNWNNFLSDGNNSGYIEIQAGLARTQLEHIPMPADEVWTWVEGYGAFSGSADVMHGEWQGAVEEVETALSTNFNGDMEGELSVLKELDATPLEFIHIGSGWGALENVRRAADNEKSLSDVFEFPEFSLTEAQREWTNLLENGRLSERRVEDKPLGYLVDKKWCERLEAALENTENRNWYAYMQLGVMRYALGLLDEAREAFEESLKYRQNAWANRNLAMLWRNEYQNNVKATEYITAAVKLQKNCRGIWLDAATTYLRAEKPELWLEAFENAPDTVKSDGRLQLYYVSALMKQGRYEEAADILKPGFEMPDMKEADTDLSDLWRELYGALISKNLGITDEAELDRLVEEKYPLGKLDFRTH